eukprot:TRINITY_DN31508_c0_g1_i1.p1 TRINITY_DN31508_c0_g1~~TRINITY_DN31508_c0_g1_i1.p1  ORF type:complete len:762 (-),score=139.29 TRINITY_DN31508_c0_g1_i1:173-2458(-)
MARGDRGGLVSCAMDVDPSSLPLKANSGRSAVAGVRTPALPRKTEDQEVASLAVITSGESWYGQGKKKWVMNATSALELVSSCPGHTAAVCEGLVVLLSAGSKEAQLMAVSVAGRDFPSRQALKDHCRTLLTRTTPGEHMDPQDSLFLKGLLDHHPRGPEKGRGVKAFTTGTRESNGENMKFFAIIREEGQEDFSYVRCVDNVATEEVRAQEAISELLVYILQLHPNACEPVARAISEKYPFLRGKSANIEKHRNWIRCVLHLASSIAVLTEFLLVTLVRRVIEIDVDILKHEDEENCFTDEIGTFSMTNRHDGNNLHLMAQILDVMMLRIFEFLQRRLDPTGKNVGAVENQLVGTLLGIFEGHLLMTHKTRCVQFLYFYFTSLRPAWAEALLTKLLQIAYGVGQPPPKRMISMAYLASYVVRAKFLTTKYVLRTTQYLAAFSREQVQAAENRIVEGEVASSQVRLFLYAVQCVCYILCWHTSNFAAEITESGQSGLEVLMHTGPEAIVPVLQSSCQPITGISGTIARQFIRTIRAYVPSLADALKTQLAKACLRREGVVHDTALDAFAGRRGATKQGEGMADAGIKDLDENDDDDELDSLKGFFPFDPYRLRNSSVFVKPHYTAFSEVPVPECDEDSDEDVERPEGFQGGTSDREKDVAARGRAGSTLSSTAGDDSDDVDIELGDGVGNAAERGFVPSVGPSPAFRPQRADMADVSPLLLDMEGVDEDDGFALPQPSMQVSTGNSTLDRMMNTPAYGAGR